MSTEKLLAVLHVVGGIAMLALAFQTTFWAFLVIMLAYQLAYIPTMSLTNAIAFHHVQDARKDFGRIRLAGGDRVDCRQPAVRLHPGRQDR